MIESFPLLVHWQLIVFIVYNELLGTIWTRAGMPTLRIVIYVPNDWTMEIIILVHGGENFKINENRQLPFHLEELLSTHLVGVFAIFTLTKTGFVLNCKVMQQSHWNKSNVKWVNITRRSINQRLFYCYMCWLAMEWTFVWWNKNMWCGDLNIQCRVLQPILVKNF